MPPYCNHLINQKVISDIDVYKVLNGLDISKATGPDNIRNKLLKEASIPITEPISHFLIFSLSLGTFPDAWKLANVIPILKKGDTMLCTKYCPKTSFFPSTIRSWNSLNSQCHEAHINSQFSTLINNMYDCKKRLFLHCVSRSSQVVFTQLRVGFCNLNYDLYIKNCVEAGHCEYGHIREDSKHYHLQCSNYTF